MARKFVFETHGNASFPSERGSWIAYSNASPSPELGPTTQRGDAETREHHSLSLASAAMMRSPEKDKISSYHIWSNAVTCPPALSESATVGRLIPISSSWLDRYETPSDIPKDKSHYTVDALTTTFDLRHLPAGWTPCTHPEGALYFVCDDGCKRISTYANLYHESALAEINKFTYQLQAMIDEKSIQLPPKSELVLELFDAECGYYFVNHEARCLFWLEPFDISPILADVMGVTCPSHIKHEMESQYWNHWDCFPDSRELSSEVIDELKDFLIFAIGDTHTSSAPTWPFDAELLGTFLKLVDRIDVSNGKPSSCTAGLVGRLMLSFTHHKFINFYGQHGARLDFTHSVHGNNNYQRSWFLVVLSPLLFYSPDVHLQSLQMIWVDGLVRLESWNKFIEKLNSGWLELTLYATVLLNANVAFLAIPSVDSGPNLRAHAVAQLASYLSTVASAGSIILGLLNVRQNNSRICECGDEAVQFLHNKMHPRHGFEMLAIVYSLPYALLMWSAILFLSAFLSMCFIATSPPIRVVAGVAWCVVVILILCCVWAGWDWQGFKRWRWPSRALASFKRKFIQKFTLPI